MCNLQAWSTNLGRTRLPLSRSTNDFVLFALTLSRQDHTSAPVIAKYDQLSRSTKLLVQAAAVIGQEVVYVIPETITYFVLDTRGVE